jgi:hypothetical protein
MTDEVDRLAAEDAPRATTDQLQQVRELAIAAKTKELMIAAAQEKLRDLEQDLDRITSRLLPELMDKSGVSSVTVEAIGNQPAFTVKIHTMYRANIGADWEPERRAAAFAWLDANGHGSLIKTEVTTSFGRQDRDEAKEFMKSVTAMGYQYTSKEGVPWKTLSSWLREMITHRGVTPPLDTIGGYVERQAVIKDEPRE